MAGSGPASKRLSASWSIALAGSRTRWPRARALAGISANAQTQLRYYPQVENPFRNLGRAFGASSESVEALARINAVLSDPRVQRAMAAVREEDANVRAESGRITVH